MSLKCENCGKGSVHGISQRHGRGVAGKRWKKRAQETKRLFMPNIKVSTVIVNGKPARLKLCTRCIKRFKKEGQLARQRVHSPASL